MGKNSMIRGDWGEFQFIGGGGGQRPIIYHAYSKKAQWFLKDVDTSFQRVNITKNGSKLLRHILAICKGARELLEAVLFFEKETSWQVLPVYF